MVCTSFGTDYLSKGLEGREDPSTESLGYLQNYWMAGWAGRSSEVAPEVALEATGTIEVGRVLETPP